MSQLSPAAEALLLAAEQRLTARELGAALVALDQAEQAGADPDACAAGRWMAFMLRGNYELGWQQSDAIRQRGRPDPHRYWQGEDLTGKRVVVRCLHGFGDLVQGLRYASLLRDVAATVTWEVPPRMQELVRCAVGVESVTDWSTPPALGSWDVQAEVTELPYVFRTNLADLPLAERYLRLPQRLLRQHAVRGRQPRVGVVWAAGDWDPARSIPLPLLQPVLTRSRCTLINLQGGQHCAEWQGIGRCAEGCLALAATIAQLDLVVTVDTFAAHLAGSLGVPGFVLLQHAADWRWMAEGTTSPWYPSLRLMRQPSPGDWPGALACLESAFADWLAALPHDGTKSAEPLTSAA